MESNVNKGCDLQNNGDSNSQFNLCEILSGREGMWVWSPLWGSCKVIAVGDKYINLVHGRDNTIVSVDASGRDIVKAKLGQNCNCLIFPSKRIRNWKNWKLARFKPRLQEIYFSITNDSDYMCVEQNIWNGRQCDIDNYSLGNCFADFDQAILYADEINALLKDRPLN